jgi:hypothetical protein
LVAEVRLLEVAKRDVLLPADAVSALKNPSALAGFDVLGLLLVRGFSARSITATGSL